MEGPATAAPVEDLRLNAKDRPLALYVGNLESYQGVHLLIQAMAALAPAERPALVVIGGKADHVAQHRQLALQCGLEDDVRLLGPRPLDGLGRSEEHTSELQSLMRISYAVFCLKKKKQKKR